MLFVFHRDIWPKDLIGNSSNDVTGILNVYCKYLSEEHSGKFYINSCKSKISV